MIRIEREAADGTDFQHRHWEDAWQGWTLETIEAAVRWEGILPLARRAFPRGAALLEAGCGVGTYCVALDRLGYRMTGIDFARSGLEALRAIAPHIEGVLGSVLELPFLAASFDGALSLGVVEHFEEGPERAIAELARVVRPGGRLLLTVPFENLLARWGGRPRARGVFYQYLYRREEIGGKLEAAGFRIEETSYLGRQLGLMERIAPRPGAATRRDAGTPRAAGGGWKARVKRAAPGLARGLRDAQLRLTEAALPGPLCAHTIAFVATRQPGQ